MTALRTTVARAMLLASWALIALRGTALGHTSGAAATPEHVLLELAGWGLGLATILGLVVLIFWLRAKRHKE